MSDALAVVTLKRKVHSLDTNLLEWRRCNCTITRELALVLELSDDDVDDVVLFRESDDHEQQPQLRGACRVVIDLGTQLQRVEQRRKNKTRCELEYIAATSGAVVCEELMASSTKHCQQFVDQLHEFERQAKRKQSIRLGSALAANAAAMTASGSMSVASSSTTQAAAAGPRESRISPPRVQTEHLRAARATSAASAAPSDDAAASGATGSSAKHSALSTPDHSTYKSEEISVARAVERSASREPTRVATRRRGDAAESAASDTECWTRANSHHAPGDYESDTLDSSSGVVSPRGVVTVAPIDVTRSASRHSRNSAVSASVATPSAAKPLALSQLSSASDASSAATNKLLQSSKPLPSTLFAQRLASVRTSPAHHQHNDNNGNSSSDDDDDDDESYDNRRHDRLQSSLPRANTTRRALGSLRRRPSVSALASSLAHSHHHHRYDQQTHHNHLLRRNKPPGLLRRRSSAGASTTAASLAANLHRLRLREQRSSNQHQSHTANTLATMIHNNNNNNDDDDVGSDNRAELHILMRVETALRQLEKENALAKEREQALAQEVQTLRDALRVQSAAQQHADAQCDALARESDEWRDVAQRAERTAAQLEDELAIAREEAQLLHSETRRLKHQNKELLTHVHRLDSLVYGRFS